MDNEKTSPRVSTLASRALKISADHIFADVHSRGIVAATELADLLHSLAGSALTQARDRRGILGRLFSRRPDG